MRLFVAVDVPEPVKDALEAGVVEPLRLALPGARWTRPEGRHLTLKFLGEVAGDKLPELEAALAEAAGGGAFECAFCEVGGFPNLGRPRVLWAGIGPGAEEMAAVAGRVDEAVARLGFPREQRRFRAHLTLARFKQPARVTELPATSVPAESFKVSEVVLYRSQLHPKGARYTALRRFAL